MVQESIPEFKALLTRAAPIFREHFHRQAYSGDSNDDIHLRDGTQISRPAVEESIDQFTGEIVKACGDFIQEHTDGNIYAAVLTGGGSMCSQISSRIAKGISKYNIAIIRAHRGANTENLDPIAGELVRGSSAIGGTSVLYAFKN
jgi:hypothetical protein